MTDKIKTYVLVGADDEFAGLSEYENRSDVIILRPKPGESIEAVAKKIHGPASVILQAHGGEDGTFTWNKGDSLSYSQLFSALPRTGILSITLGSCYGGSAQADAMLRAAPPGTLVQSMTGPFTVSTSHTTIKFAKETSNLTRPVDLYLEALDNFNPKTYRDFEIYVNKRDGKNHITDPEQALPHMIGLGGNPPLRIDLHQQMETLQGHGQDPALKRAIARVKAQFDTDEFHPTKPSEYGPDGSLGTAAEKALDGRIAAMGQKLAQGYQPKGAEEKRLAYAITAAYLDESGKLQAMIERQIKLDANGKRINPNAPLHSNATGIFGPLEDLVDSVQHTYNARVIGITSEEQAYINSVAAKLNANPAMKGQMDAVLKGLVTSFSQSRDNDLLNPNSQLVQTLHQAGISTKSWER